MTTDGGFGGESPVNYEQKCACMLVLDVSGSMAGEPIALLSAGLAAFRDEVIADFTAAQRLEVGIITFSSTVTVERPFALLDGTGLPQLNSSGTTKLVDGVRKAAEEIEARKSFYKSTGQNYYRPIMVLMTDGAPDADQDVAALSAEVRAAVAQRKYLFWAVGTKGYRHDLLAQIAPPETPPLALEGLKYAEFFKWLSNSISIVTKSKEGEKITLPSTSEWTQTTI